MVFDWTKWLPWIIIAVLGSALGAMTQLYLDKRDDLVALQASVKVLGEAAEKALIAKEKEGEANLAKVKEDHEKLIPKVRSDAVANYLDAHPAPRVRKSVACSGAVPKDGPSQQVDDGTQQKPVPDQASIVGTESAETGALIEVEPATIQECAVDAAKVAAFQLYCTLNNCPIRE